MVEEEKPEGVGPAESPFEDLSLDFLGEEDFLSKLLSNIEGQIFERPISDVEYDYLLKKFAFLVIKNADVEDFSLDNAEILKVPGAWDIHDNQEVLRASPGRYAWGRVSEDDEDGGGKGLTGTLAWQAIQTSQKMVDLAINRWESAEIVEGYRSMQLAASVYAKEKGYTLYGFEPTESEEVAFRKVLELRGYTPGMGM